MSEDLARRRFMILNLIRLMGVGMAMIGILAVAGKIDLPAAAGYVLLIVGMIDAFFAPAILARRWKSPPQ
jgi:hypothetical protein